MRDCFLPGGCLRSEIGVHGIGHSGRADTRKDDTGGDLRDLDIAKGDERVSTAKQPVSLRVNLPW